MSERNATKDGMELRPDGLMVPESEEKDALIYEAIKRKYLYDMVERDISFRPKSIVRVIKDMGYHVTGSAVFKVLGRTELDGEKIFRVTERTGGYNWYRFDSGEFVRFYESEGIGEKVSLHFPHLADD